MRIAARTRRRIRARAAPAAMLAIAPVERVGVDLRESLCMCAGEREGGDLAKVLCMAAIGAMVGVWVAGIDWRALARIITGP